MAKFPTYEEMAENIAKKALDEFLYDGKSIREWMQIIASEDCISRQAVVGYLCTHCPDDAECFKDCDDIKNIKALPPVKPQEPKWIPVSERLPEEEYIGVLLTINGCKGLKVRSGMYYEEDSFHSDTGEFWKATDKEVIAWMPLPTPYEPQEGDSKNDI